MARGRMINRKVTTSAKVGAYGDEYGPWALVFHHRVIAFLDVNGCCRADPFWLKAEVMPRVADVTPDDCRTFAAGLEKHGLAVLYESGGLQYLHMPGFREEQVNLRADRETPEVPPPPQDTDGGGKKRDTRRKPAGKKPATRRTRAGKHPAEDEGEVEVEVEEKRRGKKKHPGQGKRAPAGAEVSAAQTLTNRVIELGLHGQRPDNYAKHCARAQQLLKTQPLEWWLKAASGMALLYKHRNSAWDVFDLGKDGAKAYAEASRNGKAREPPPADRRAELREALAQVRRQDPQFEGGLPNPHATGVEIKRGDRRMWDELLRKAGLKTIAEMQ